MDGDGPAHEVTVIDPAGRVIDRSLLIAQEELELTRLELVEKIPLLGRGLLQLALAAALALIGAILGTLAIAWLLADYVFGIRHVWASFALMVAVVLLGAAIIALRAIRRAHVERYVARGRELGERDGEALVGALGFVAGGGASGTARLLVKAVRIVTGRRVRHLDWMCP